MNMSDWFFLCKNYYTYHCIIYSLHSILMHVFLLIFTYEEDCMKFFIYEEDVLYLFI